MGFYYPSIINLSLLILFYIIGTVVLLKIWRRYRDDKHRALKMAPLFLLLYFAPVAEELWIAWNFGHLCKKDAGIFINKVVEVDGFYDDTRPTTPVPRTKQAADDLDRGGYRFYEMVYRDLRGGANKVVRLEKINGVWTPAVLDKPTARYHYRWPNSHMPIAHKIVKHERVVVDSQTNEVLGQDIEYGRGVPWFFVGLDRPVLLCPSNHPLARYGAIYIQTLKAASRGAKKVPESNSFLKKMPALT